MSDGQSRMGASVSEAAQDAPSTDVIGPGRVAVVTGGASGIGLALSEGLVAAGSTVVVADLDLPLAARTLELYGHVDLVFNNAGISTFNLIQDQTIDDWRWVIDVDFWGVVNGIRTFLQPKAWHLRSPRA